ncbi:MAG: DUF192 domain-containing protein [Acidobacteriaceae bacterium]|nr:DUF192 domain-containing protein [Acidobacteriaceae bacterium]
MGKAAKHDAPRLTEFKVFNGDGGVPVATQIRLAGTSAARRRGLAGIDKLEEGSGLWIAPCEAIHTFGMRIPIDVVFLDGELRVRKLIERLSPARISLCITASSVLELPPGAIARSGIRRGERLRFEPCGSSGTCPRC